MPWPARRNIRNLPKDGGSRDYYYVDGSPVAADVWIHGNATQTAKAADGSEWSTVVAGGLRQGGSAYYALDVTDPAAAGYPQLPLGVPEGRRGGLDHQLPGRDLGHADHHQGEGRDQRRRRTSAGSRSSPAATTRRATPTTR